MLLRGKGENNRQIGMVRLIISSCPVHFIGILILMVEMFFVSFSKTSVWHLSDGIYDYISFFIQRITATMVSSFLHNVRFQ